MASHLPVDNFFRFPEILCYQAAKCGEVPLSLGIFAYCSFQAAVIHKVTSDQKWAQHIHKIQAVFSALNFGVIFWSAGKWINEIEKRYSITLINHFDMEAPWTLWQKIRFNGIFAAFAIASVLATVKAATFLSQRLDQKKEPEKLLKHIPEESRADRRVKWENPPPQVTLQRSLAALTAVDLALTFFSSSYRLLFLANAFASFYSLSRISQMKWINFTRIFHINDQFNFNQLQFLNHFPGFELNRVRIKQIDLTYSTLLLPFNGTKSDECAICLEKSPDSYFCENHAYHDDCLVGAISASSDSFRNQTQIVRHTFRSDNRVKQTFTLEIPEENLTACPLCRGRPFLSHFGAEIKDADYGWLPTTVKMIDKKEVPFLPFEVKAIALSVYSAAQAALSIAQQHIVPLKALFIFNIQQVMAAADAILLVENCYQLFKKLEQYFIRENDPVHTRKINRYKLSAATAFAALALGGVSFFTMRRLNQFIIPKVNLNDALGKTVPSGDLSQVTAKWNIPLMQKAMQWLLINRVIVSLASAIFLEKSRFHLANAVMQMTTLLHISRLQWIEFTRVYMNPLKNTPFTVAGKTSDAIVRSLQQATQGMKVTFHYLITPHAWNESPEKVSTGLQEALKKMYNYSTNFFQNSCWDRYLLITTHNGAEVSRVLHYVVKVLKPSFIASEGGNPQLAGISAGIQDKVYRTATSISYAK